MSKFIYSRMSFAGQKRLGVSGGALVPVKRPRQDLVPVSGHAANKQVILAVSLNKIKNSN